MKHDRSANRFFGFLRPSRSASGSRSAPKSRALRVESLEERRLLDADPVAEGAILGESVALESVEVAPPVAAATYNSVDLNFIVSLGLTPQSDGVGWREVNGKQVLVSLTIADPSISELSVDASGSLKYLDVSGCPNLVKLMVWEQALTELDVSNCAKLEELWCCFTVLTDLDLSDCTSLTSLLCFANNLSEIDLTHCENLDYLCCDNTTSTISLSHKRDVEIWLEPIRTIDPSTFTIIDDSGLTIEPSIDETEPYYVNFTVPATSSYPITVSFVSYGGEDGDEEQFSTITIDGLARPNFNERDLAALEASGISPGGEGVVWSPDGRLTELTVSKYGITNISLDNCDALEKLDVSGLRNLTSLTCENCALTELNVSGCAKLTSLVCSNNNLTELEISNLARLWDLACDGNYLTELDLSGCATLEQLLCSDNNLTELDVSLCPNLSYLECDRNDLTKLDASGCANLAYVQCNSNKLTVLDLSGCDSLQYLYCGGNNLAEIDLTECPMLFDTSFDSSVDAIYLEMDPTRAEYEPTLRVFYSDRWNSIAVEDASGVAIETMEDEDGSYFEIPFSTVAPITVSYFNDDSIVGTTVVSGLRSLIAPNVEFSPAMREVVLDISPVENATGYVVQFALNPDFLACSTQTFSSAGIQTVSGLSPRNAYYFRVKALGPDGTFSPWTSFDFVAPFNPLALVVSTTTDSDSVFGSLRYALAVARDGETITFDDSLKGQTITLSGEELVVDKSITIDATNLWDAENNSPGVTISGNDASRIFNVASGAETEFKGLNMIDGSADYGGAIIANGAKASVFNSSFKGNVATRDGGAVWTSGVAASYENVIFVNNSAGYNGGAASSGGPYSNYSNCVFYGNSATYRGGGVDGGATFVNCTIAGNHAYYGGGVRAPQALLYNTIISLNDGVIESDLSSYATLRFNSLIGVDPNFVIAPIWNDGILANLSEIDLRLAEKSWAIDRGDNSYVLETTDFNGNNRILAGWKSEPIVDIGAYEYQEAFEKTPENRSLVVTTSEDVVDDLDGKISLREALLYAEGNETVGFASELRGATIVLTNGDLFPEKSITIDGSDLGIVIDAAGKSRAFTFQSPTTLIGLTITGGRAEYAGGISACVFYSLTMDDCSIVWNSADNIGGVYVNGANFTNCAFLKNTSNYYQGGAVYIVGSSSLTNCLIAGNSSPASSYYGGNLFFSNGQESSLNIANCTIAGNIGGGIETYGDGNGTINIVNSIVALNSTFDVYRGTSKVNAQNALSSYTRWSNASSPDVVNYRYNANLPLFANTENDDYRLAPTSQAIDKGDVALVLTETDLDGNARIIDGFVDLGAYEYNEPLETPTIALSSTKTAVVVKINSVNNAEKYVVEISTSSSFKNAVEKTYSSAGVKTFANMTPGTWYYVRAKAIATERPDSEYSETMKTYTGKQLAAPSVAISSIKSAIIVKINEVQNAEKYVLEYSESEDFSNATTKTYATPGAKTVSGLTFGARYFFRVKATAATSLDSNWTTFDCAAGQLATPAQIVSKLGSDFVNIKCYNSPSAIGFEVLCSINYNFSKAQSFQCSSSGLVEITELRPGTKYYFKVRAIGDDVSRVDSNWSTVFTATTKSAPTSSAILDVSQIDSAIEDELDKFWDVLAESLVK